MILKWLAHWIFRSDAQWTRNWLILLWSPTKRLSIPATMEMSYCYANVCSDSVSHSHTGSYDCLIVRLVAIWRTCDRSAMLSTISRSGRILRSFFFAGGRSSYDWSYAWSRDRQRLEKIDGKIHHIVGNRTNSGSHKRSVVRSIVAPDDRSYEQSWTCATDSV